MAFDPNAVFSRRNISRAGGAGLVLALSGLALSPTHNVVNKPECRTETDSGKADKAAASILDRLLAGKPVRYDANVGIVCDGETTVAPLTAVENGKKVWFELDVDGTEPEVVRIQNPDAVIDSSIMLDASNRAVSYEGVVDMHTQTGMPGVDVTFEDGQHLFTAVGQAGRDD